MQTKFVVEGLLVDIIKFDETSLVDVLPAQIYELCFTKMRGFFLRITKESLITPTKIYGNTQARVDKCIQTYLDRPMSTGILMTGDKGTGKTLLLSLIANKVVKELKLPVIIIRNAYAGSEFMAFIEELGECCLVFDEFGKMYTSEDHNVKEHQVPQTALLSLMDGIDKQKRLILLTENDQYDINKCMLNRPGRVYYHFEYNKLTEESIVDYCIDLNISDDITQKIVDLSRRTRIFSFDMLQSIVEEHLRFGCNIEDATADLNVDVREKRNDTIKVIEVLNKITKQKCEIYETPFIDKPDNYSYFKIKSLTKDNSVKVRLSASVDTPVEECSEECSEESAYIQICLEKSDLSYESNGKAVYETQQYTILTENVPMSTANYNRYFQ